VRVAIIGGTGHIGSFLTPRLVEAGHAVICISRGLKDPYRQHAAWGLIERVEMDRAVEEEAGSFGERVAGLDADVVIDLTCYQLASAEQLVEALRGNTGHLLHHLGAWTECRSANDRGSAAHSIRRLRGKKGCDRGLSSARSAPVSAAGNDPASRAPRGAWLGSSQSRGQL
jgi:NAD(P)-dependent dehydrogenase (short-subunit alcohol dehydrogenase family)